MNARPRSWTLFALAALAAGTLASRPAAAQDGAPRKRRLVVSFKAGTTRAEREDAARELGMTLREDYDKLGVSVLEGGGQVGPEDMTRAAGHARVAAAEEDVYRNWLLEAPAFQTAPFPTVEAVMGALGRARTAPAPAPEASAAGGRTPWGVARVDAPAAWSRGQGAGIKVAVVDTGIDCTHPDLKCDFGAGMNVVDPGSDPMDDNEHGTHVAGTIAGRGVAGGVAGVAPKATLIPVKVLDASGSGSLSDIVRGISWAADAGADVINLSLGGPNGSAALQRAVQGALNAGVVVVAAAGNSGPEPDTVGFPGGYPGVIAVAASDETDQIPDFSSRGPAVAFIAPGVKVESTVPKGGYKKLSGTSMASPHMAGLAALALERGARGPAGVRAAFKAAASRLCPASGCWPADFQGAGLVDAAKLR